MTTSKLSASEAARLHAELSESGQLEAAWRALENPSTSPKRRALAAKLAKLGSALSAVATTRSTTLVFSSGSSTLPPSTSFANDPDVLLEAQTMDMFGTGPSRADFATEGQYQAALLEVAAQEVARSRRRG